MKKVKSVFVSALAMLMAISAFTGCTSSSTNASSAASSAAASQESSAASSAKEIYFLNFKPEIADKYTAIADEYKQKTGVTVKVVTAASGTYEQTLKSEIAKADAPTIFQINGPVGYSNWKDYCADLSNTKLYSYLSAKNLAIKDGDGVYGIPYAIEGYGIIYNDAIMKKYFALSDKKTTVSSAEEIKNFDTLKTVVEDMQAKKDKLGIKGVFAATSLKKGEDWRWQTHLANIPFYYEFKEKDANANTISTGLAQSEVEFKYAPNFKNIFDLYLNNSSTDKKLLGSKSVNDSMAEFALGQVAMVQNGDWAWATVSSQKGNVVKSEDVKFMPIYTGMSGEEKQGICIGTENYFAINSKVSKEKQDASADFLDWLFSSTEGKKHIAELGFIAPFNTFSDSEMPTDPLCKAVLTWQNKTDVTNVEWTFGSFPSQNFKDTFGADLLQYAQGNETWEDVVNSVKDTWKSEKANSNS
ncbi:MAG TPA: ABC transporter substrate-binding protein [Clostridiales bacterium]|nr:ABC transporter substrate-binding protein [Clostridiales bacterium]